MQLYTAIITIYQQLYALATLRPKYTYTPQRQDRIQICKFIKWINVSYKPHQITGDFLISYFEFQFSRYSGIKTPRGKNSIMLNWIIGQKAIIYWEKRTPGKRYYIKWRCNKDFKLKLTKPFAQRVKVNRVPFVFSLNQYEEVAKQRFYNKPTGYAYCAAMTTLYNPLSSLCNACKYKKACTERLNANFPLLYKKRVQHETVTA